MRSYFTFRACGRSRQFVNTSKLFLLFLAVSLNGLTVFSQSIDVDRYTGTPIITVPIHTVNDRTLSHSIYMYYDASGVKVDALPGSTGQNWELIAGGEVRRVIRGLPDDYYTATVGDNRRGWLRISNGNVSNNANLIGNYTFPVDGSALSCVAEPAHYTFINGFASNVDSEPDLFHFNAGGFSGTFVFDNTGSVTSVKTVPYQEIQVKANGFSATTPISSFEITDATGVKYTFSTQETIEKDCDAITPPLYFQRNYKLYANPVSYVSAWKLTQIDSPVGESIQFGYSTRNITSGDLTQIVYPTKTSLTLEYTTTTETTIAQLTSITTPHQSVVIDYTSLGENYAQTTEESLLDKITVNETSPATTTLVKSAKFNYTPVPTGGVGRWFLKKVIMSDNCEIYPPYLFHYYDVDLDQYPIVVDFAAPGSFYQDIWGYFKPDLTLVSGNPAPTLYVYPASTGIQKVSLFQRTGAGTEIIISGTARHTTTAPTTGMLSWIDYPSGSRSSFIYEPHEFQNPITGTVSTGGGFRIKTIEVTDLTTNQNRMRRTFEYKKADNSSSGNIFTMPSFHQVGAVYKDPSTGTYTDWSTISGMSASDQWNKLVYRTWTNINPDFESTTPIGYSRVTEMLEGNGKTVYEFEVPNTFGSASTADWNPTYTLLARSNSCPVAGLNTNGFFYAPASLQTPFDYSRGLPTKISWYAESDIDPVREVVNTYADKAISSATVKGLSYEFFQTSSSASSYYFMYGAYKLTTNKVRLLSTTTQRLRDKVTPAVYTETASSYTYGNANHPFLTTSTVTSSNGDQTINRTKYVKDYTYSAIVSSDPQVDMIDKMYEKGRMADVIEQTSSVLPSGGTEVTVSGSLSLFNNFGTTPAPVILPAQVQSLVAGNGIASFSMSTYSGSGAGRTFQKNSNYRTMSTLMFKAKGDGIRSENSQRQYQGYHPDNLTGLRVASIQDAEPHEVIYSSFDHDTDYDFDQIAFVAGDKTAAGRTGHLGIAGWAAGSGKMLKKTITKKPSSKYVFSAWYKSPVSTGTHSLVVTIKNTSNVQLQQQTITYTITAANTWYFKEATFDLSAVGNTDVVVEVTFGGSYSAPTTSVVDDVTFVPEGSEMVKNTYHTAYGVTSQTAPDNRITEYEYDGRGRQLYIRDHDRNILQKTSYKNYAASEVSSVPLTMQAPAVIYDNVAATFTAQTGCLDIASIKWKISPESDTTQGTYINGSTTQPLTFTSAGTFVVKVKINHPSYGTYLTYTTVVVELKPLEIEICATGTLQVDLCTQTSLYGENCDPSPPPTTIVSTNFKGVTAATGCGGGATYTYIWQKRPYHGDGYPWVVIAGTPPFKITVLNTESYDLRLMVTSSCGRVGYSNIKSVYVSHASDSCN